MREQLELYIRECEWLGEKGFLNGNGLYLTPGADGIPLMFSQGHLTGISGRRWDALSMAKLLENIGECPKQHLGEYKGVDENSEMVDHWERYTQVVVPVQNTPEIKRLLGDVKFDYIIFKGFRDSVFPSHRGTPDFETFFQFLARNYTHEGTTILASFASSGFPLTDGATIGVMKDTCGFSNVTDDYFDMKIGRVRMAYPWSYEHVNVEGMPKTERIGNPEVTHAGLNVLVTTGDFGIFKRK